VLVKGAPKSPPASQGPPLQHCPGNVLTHLRAWRTCGLQDEQTLPCLLTVVPSGRPCRCCSFCHVSECPSPRPTLDGLPGPPDSPTPVKPHTDSTCLLCHSEATLPDVSSSAHDLPWLHIIHHLFMCPAGPGRPPLFQFGSKMLLLTSDWPHYHCRLGILFADINIHPSAPACSCTLFTPLYTDFLCLHADPLEVENPPPGFLAAEQKHRWLDPLATMACFLRIKCPALSHATPAPACSAPCTASTAITLDSMYGPPASITSVLVCSPVVSPGRFLGPTFPVSRCLACLVLPARSAIKTFLLR
jgi:hypothetical protein